MSAATLPLAGIEPAPPDRIQRRVWLDLELPADVDVDDALAQALWFQLTIAPADAGDIRGFEGVGYYVEVSCRVCGCTDSNACGDGCWWVAADLCSSCAESLELVDPRPIRTVPVAGGVL